VPKNIPTVTEERIVRYQQWEHVFIDLDAGHGRVEPQSLSDALGSAAFEWLDQPQNMREVGRGPTISHSHATARAQSFEPRCRGAIETPRREVITKAHDELRYRQLRRALRFSDFEQRYASDLQRRTCDLQWRNGQKTCRQHGLHKPAGDEHVQKSPGISRCAGDGRSGNGMGSMSSAS